ncbi:MAG: hypothetical protein QOG43_406 [Actinomycetota bacterium]|jgi:glycosyltransferase involved in cell wall biosynthesis|nr:hypothetical protein [Actinomycetota bacterium]
MRIVVVSAHFPPNFVSGGTLQPQRLAQGLRARGHDVSVYAGWLGERPPLESWEDVDGTGLPVRWVVSGRWIGWGDERNFDNPDVGAHFAAHLAQVRPDVVHLHALQSLGGNLVPIAAAAGAKVVVTMHDFWWCCPRQFLVDRTMHPCSLVVAAGCCPCEVDRDWLDDRNRRLTTMLAGADLILAPSASAARVLAANGVDPARLEVDENGLPDGARAPTSVASVRSAPGGGGPVRFLFTGGTNPMKGGQVLFDAARRMASLPGWRLTAYGWDGPARDDQVAPPPPADRLPVDILPPFDPADQDAVYAGADVVVVPSLMRESYSIVTREALTRGLPVVCTDTLGPEEVVNHGGNGLVVPAGDGPALAAALRSLVAEPGLLDRLRAGCQPPLPVRSIDAQVDGLVRSYEGLVAGYVAAPGSPRRRTVRRVLFVVGIEGAPLRYRARLPAEALGLVGVESDVRHYRHPDVPRLAAAADAVVVYRVPATVEILAVIASVRARGVPVLFDVDDLIFDPGVASEIPALEILPPEEAELWLEGVRRYRTTMEACDAFIGTTAALCRHATEVTGLPAWRFPNGVGMLLGAASDEALHRGRQPGPPRIGYLSGTDTHDLDWAHVEPAIVEILTRHPGVELWLAGMVTASAALDPFSARVVRLPFLPWPGLPRVLRQVDVNLAPLAPGSRFNECKSAIKWLESALVETPTVASPTEPFREAIEAGVTGLLAATVGEWVEAIDRLLVDDDLRQAMGRRARREALLRWSPHLQAHRYREILESAEVRDASLPSSLSSSSGWVAVAHTEPPHPFELEPYGEAPAAPVAPPAAASRRARAARVEAGRLVSALRESVRTDGPRSTAVRLTRYSAKAVRRRLDRSHRNW